MRYKLIIEYDGTPFIGWQKQQTGLSVQGTLEKALKTALRTPVDLFGSGRTDSGVHALGQVAHFDYSAALDCFKLCKSLNALVRPYPISIREIETAGASFHARFSAKERTYVYRILNTSFPPALNKNRVWWYVKKLNVEKMNQAAQLLVGKHDFSTFRSSECQAKSPVKTLNFIELARKGEEIVMTIKAKSFLHHQVRNIIGTLINVGNGSWSIDDFQTAFNKKSRIYGGQTAPASGLYFMSVLY